MNITIVGTAKSGMAAALLAKRKGFKPFVTELKNKEDLLGVSEQLKKNEIEFEMGGHSGRGTSNCDLIVTSPGVPPGSDLLSSAEKKGIKIISELEFGWMNLNNNPTIAITGTNGKTTTTALTEYIFKQAGRKAIAAGNIGTPLSSIADNVDSDTYIILEVSSYQLDRIDKFRPDVAAILNLSPDHTAYHGNVENYYKSKWKISSNQSGKNLLILNNDDAVLSGMNYRTDARIAKFSVSPVDWGIYVKGGILRTNLNKQHNLEDIMPIEEIGLPGIHNLYNSMAATLSARAFEIRNEDIRDSLASFQGVEHRLEFVRTINGIDFINDSKATNINATWFALISYKKPLVWIAGGRGDSNDYSVLDEAVAKNVKAIVAIGEDADNIFNHYCSKTRVVKAKTMEEAVEFSYEIANPGEIVLFTPACKSFDMFMNFEHRGQIFKEIVNEL